MIRSIVVTCWPWPVMALLLWAGRFDYCRPAVQAIWPWWILTLVVANLYRHGHRLEGTYRRLMAGLVGALAVAGTFAPRDGLSGQVFHPNETMIAIGLVGLAVTTICMAIDGDKPWV
jgi:hypothetical protein